MAPGSDDLSHVHEPVLVQEVLESEDKPRTVDVELGDLGGAVGQYLFEFLRF